jgi:hypothetical protein
MINAIFILKAMDDEESNGGMEMMLCRRGREPGRQCEKQRKIGKKSMANSALIWRCENWHAAQNR